MYSIHYVLLAMQAKNNKFIFLTIIQYTNTKLCAVGHICKMSSIIYNMFLS